MKILLRATTLAAILVFGGNVNAGIVWEINYVGSFDSLGNSITVDLSDASTNDSSFTHQLEFRFSMTDLAADEDFAAATFDLNLGGGISESAIVPGWQPANGQFVFSRNAFTNATTEKAHWLENGDEGDDKNDLKTILVRTNVEVANNRQYGEAGRPSTGEPDRGGTDLGNPTLVGDLFVQWDGTPSELSLAKTAGNAFSLWQNNQNGTGAMEAFIDGFQGATLQFGSGAAAVPTASISGAGTGAVTLDYFGSASTGLSLDGNGITFEITSLQGGDLALFLELDGVSDLDTLASDLTGGGVTASTNASNPFLPGANLSIVFAGDYSGSQFVTLADLGAGVTITGAAVPEPSTFVLTGLALVGMFGCGWRRRRSS